MSSHADVIVERFLGAADALYAQRAALYASIARSSGLSERGVALGFECLERACDAQARTTLVARAPSAPLAYVLLSANVFVASFRALLLARLGAPRVVVRPSSRDPRFTELLVEALADPDVLLDSNLVVPHSGAGLVHLYGSDETIESVRAETTLPLYAHGTGFGIAYVGPNDDATPLSLDVITFDQRGCLSPKVVFVEGDAARALQVGGLLHGALQASDVPRGDVEDGERAQILQFTETLRMLGVVHADASHVVGIMPEARVASLPPAARSVLVVPVRDPAEAVAVLGAGTARRYVTQVGVSEPSRAAQFRMLLPGARLASLGRMQRPPLDGPVDLRAVPRA